MNDTAILIVIALIFLAIGIFLGIYIQKLKIKSLEIGAQEREKQMQASLESLKSQLEEVKQERNTLDREKQDLALSKNTLEIENQNLLLKLKEHKEEVTKLQEQFSNEFEVLAQKILEEKTEKFTSQNKENIKNILAPLQEKIKAFEEKVERSQEKNISLHSELKGQLQHLQSLNQKITQETENLTKALKGDSKTQGNWGELVLERVLEKSGLEKGREYFVQQSFKREDGSRVLPDVVINLPDNKKIIIDSKVSLTAYERYITTDDSTLKADALKEHLNSIKKHVEQLSEKKYEDLYEIESPDFVLMFIPIEPAFAVALSEDNTLYNKAFEKNIVIVTPTTLLATLRTIDTMWNNEKQQRNAIDIAKQAGALYDKFEGLVNDLTRVGKKMDDAKTEYKNAMNKLFEGRGNIITTIEKIKKMGAKAKKSLPEPILKRAQENELDE